MRISDRRFALFLMAPAALFLAIFVAFPLFRLVADSFYKISPIAGGPRDFVGLDNYVRAFASEAFTGAGWRTLAYTLVVVTLEFALGLGMALLFTMLGKSSQIWRTVFMYPLMIAPIVAGLLWKFLMIDNFGLIGTLLHQAGILSNPNQIGWLSDPNIVLFSVAIPDIWLTTSFMCLVLFAGLQNIPGDLIEAARLDGARAHDLLFRIILPLLRPVIAVALVVRGIDAARAFDTILIQTNGGPQSASETMSLLIYRTMIRFGDPGLASAMGTIYLLAMLAVAFFAVATIWRPGKDN
ncbi:binding-protein-dependent transport systems inner membrane component [Pseudarthrobacter chlorophenolicus A6]|uniref:Binding-protein-dependent transport systems inner membrane component n=1 Tax=Pseudarthrobacter chlorophenolicus (strain ATCC 700700 / DSM 12829 / CIP 107037 / JCM 12360 / KCTC 9906 / NCIMB 13794 / A6) TaxID=452863 RepID=B8HEB9_PSECP|nr:sugar ABC transporter permease [Pseudarthrobacter chlorophenolicus]ACL40864.1 binding-protein-dependent transport systems inner membrane component [Pseudarthrobacter chlorophenolicus A6]SDQ73783.1 carbohydrate ABC transporter membrane protein 1, CUT1 family [Pseudarthrobacter chlorophenolicus]